MAPTASARPHRPTALQAAHPLHRLGHRQAGRVPRRAGPDDAHGYERLSIEPDEMVTIDPAVRDWPSIKGCPSTTRPPEGGCWPRLGWPEVATGGMCSASTGTSCTSVPSCPTRSRRAGSPSATTGRSAGSVRRDHDSHRRPAQDVATTSGAHAGGSSGRPVQPRRSPQACSGTWTARPPATVTRRASQSTTASAAAISTGSGRLTPLLEICQATGSALDMAGSETGCWSRACGCGLYVAA
jgi:hypothetical protein